MREMKDSGIKYIAEMPAEWKTIRCKYISAFINGFAFESKELQSDFCYPVIRIGNIADGKIDLTNCVRVNKNKGLDKYQIKKDDILLAMSGATVGKVGLSDKTVDAYINQRVGIIRTENPKFLFYCLSTREFLEYIVLMANGSAQPNVSEVSYGEYVIPFPSSNIQREIVSFLDSQCSEIDAISADIQKEIETLEQYKRSVITEAVTKGLNPDAEMKDSGIEWVGNIPAHWDAIPIRYLFAECRLKNTLNQEKTALKFTYGTIIKKTNFDSDSDEYVANTMTNYTLVNPGTIMINGLNLNYDFVSQRVGLVKDRGAITSAYLAIAPGNRVVSEYANYQLKSWDYAKAFHNMGTGVRKTLDFSELGKKYFVTPSIEEQSEIVTFLDSKCKEIESTIESKKQQLTVIDSYKKSLIYEYVTGKKEVPNEQ